MLDPFVLLAPILLLPVIGLLGFIGCALIVGLGDYQGPPAKTLKIRINCGGPSLPALPGEPAGTLSWSGDGALATGGQSQSNTLGSHVKESANGPDVVGDIYETRRQGNSFSYSNLPLDEGDYKITLKFAVIDSNANFIGVFRYNLNGDRKTVDSATFGIGVKFDVTHSIHIDASKTLTLIFEEDQPAHGVLPFVNGIEVETA